MDFILLLTFPSQHCIFKNLSKLQYVHIIHCFQLLCDIPCVYP